MNIKDRFLNFEEIFDKEALKSPKWHEKILKKRKEKFENNEMKFISIHELKKRKSKNDISRCAK